MVTWLYTDPVTLFNIVHRLFAKNAIPLKRFVLPEVYSTEKFYLSRHQLEEILDHQLSINCHEYTDLSRNDKRHIVANFFFKTLFIYLFIHSLCQKSV